ncbi:transcriptional regulator [Amylibacter sp. SFDW26]|uniref:ChrR family anti-sigma-E factor n=1 Tax=Amylibacter sp. SFDW26 TaxID=2652722 RepID=UPI001262588E|nr:ChrR family anti-sigma-E factor [Amylibacter sp. SFDW26]KAB7616034.1 transcriptional regulator [Amylibacter sp. SFDW26]
MKIQHHLSEELIMGYAAGILPEAFELAVATHISMCDECRAAVEAYEAVGGSVLDDTETMSISDDSFEATLAKINGAPAPTPKLAKNDSIFPRALQHYVGENPDAVKWKSLGMGVKQAILKTSKGASARLLHIEAGRAVPDHGHRGTELTLVLQGAFADEVDRFGRGDIEIADEDLEHTPRAEMGEDCICLAVTDAPLRFNAIIPRLLQPFFRI